MSDMVRVFALRLLRRLQKQPADKNRANGRTNEDGHDDAVQSKPISIQLNPVSIAPSQAMRRLYWLTRAPDRQRGQQQAHAEEKAQRTMSMR